MAEVKAIKSSQGYVGKRIKRTKVRYAWTFELDNVQVTCVLLHSRLSKKLSIYLNASLVYLNKKDGPFRYQLEFQDHQLAIVEGRGTFDLQVDGTGFHSLPTSQASTNSFCPATDSADASPPLRHMRRLHTVASHSHFLARQAPAAVK